ncbi:MAG: 50S ribosomal protein L24 [Gammaproteobacteria bacterium]|nr:50S ribosomal protein L24 [Gammaproteobacteria bacterium]
MQKIKKGDEVIVIAGKDKGKSGKVIKIVKKRDDLVRRVLVEGVNLVKKHMRANPNKDIEAQILSKEAAMDISNVAILNPITKKADRVGFKFLEDGRKVRYFKSNDEVVDLI